MVLNMETNVGNIPLKYPVVLVHGIIAHDRKGLIHFWGRIPEELEAHGLKVFFGNTDAWGEVKSNAELLHKTIEKILHDTKSEKVNIIAHSKGGIDSRYLIWKYKYGDKVASLTTVSTPHHGAEIADLIFKQDFMHSRVVKKTLAIFGELYGDVNPDLLKVDYELTTPKMKEFNKNVVSDSRVFYQSMYTSMKNSFDDLMFFNSYQYIKYVSGKNDGLVSEYSARWGDNVIKIDGGISHAEIIDIKRRKISGIHVPDIYINIVEDLCRKGF
jgi:triacylglycerol lipase